MTIAKTARQSIHFSHFQIPTCTVSSQYKPRNRIAKHATCIDILIVDPRLRLAMLPPVSPDLLKNNPGFAVLHKYLIDSLLSLDGSSLSVVDTRETDTVYELSTLREIVLSDAILIQALEEISLNDVDHQRQAGIRPLASYSPEAEDQLPSDLEDLIYTISLYLRSSLDTKADSPLPSDTDGLMAESVSHFQRQLSQVAAGLSTHLVRIERQVAKVMSDLNFATSPIDSAIPVPTNKAKLEHTRKSQPTNSSSSNIPPLDTQVNMQHAHMTRLLTCELPTLLSSTTDALGALHKTTHDSLAQTITHLERDVHGTRSRHIQARARHLAAVAQGIALKTRVQRHEIERDLRSDTVLMQKLQEAADHASVEEATWAEKERALEEVVGEYTCQEPRSVGVELFGRLGRKYRTIEEEIGTVRNDIEMLEKQLKK